MPREKSTTELKSYHLTLSSSSGNWYGGGEVGGGIMLLYYLIYNPGCPHFNHCTHDLTRASMKIAPPLQLSPLDGGFHFLDVSPPPSSLARKRRTPPYILSLYIYFISISPQIIASNQILVSWWPATLSYLYLTITISSISLLTLSPILFIISLSLYLSSLTHLICCK